MNHQSVALSGVCMPQIHLVDPLDGFLTQLDVQSFDVLIHLLHAGGSDDGASHCLSIVARFSANLWWCGVIHLGHKNITFASLLPLLHHPLRYLISHQLEVGLPKLLERSIHWSNLHDASFFGNNAKDPFLRLELLKTLQTLNVLDVVPTFPYVTVNGRFRRDGGEQSSELSSSLSEDMSRLARVN